MLNIANITKVLGGQELLSQINFQINPQEKVGLVGPNGAGKTTIFRLIVGDDRPDGGQISLQAHTRIAYFSQSTGEMSGRTALAEVISGDQETCRLMERLEEITQLLADPALAEQRMMELLDEMGEVQTAFEKRGGHQLEASAQEILTGLGISPNAHHLPVQHFSGGMKMRIALAKVLICNPDLILMDEPTNYLDMETILWLEQWLKNFKGAILMTTHDREFMNAIVNKVVEIAGGKVYCFTGNYDFYLQEKALRKKHNEAEFNRQRSMLKKEEEFIAKFAARASHAAQVQSRVKKIDKIEKVVLEKDDEEISILLPEIPRGSNEVLVINDLSKEWQDESNNARLIFKNLTATINRQEKVALVGVNGAGKSTLLKILANKTEPTSGSFSFGPSIKMGYYGQHTIDILNYENTIFEELRRQHPDKSDGFLRNLLAAFLFKGDEVFKKIKFLSGGEKARVVLASLLSYPYNFLIFDEPTNHLDIKAREVFLDALQRYQGTLLLVSHDRYFLNHLATKVMEISAGQVYLHPGDYPSYCQNKAALPSAR